MDLIPAEDPKRPECDMEEVRLCNRRPNSGLWVGGAEKGVSFLGWGTRSGFRLGGGGGLSCETASNLDVEASG